MKFRVVGAERDTGADVDIIIEAPDEVEASAEAERRNILWTDVKLVRKPNPKFTVFGIEKDTGTAVTVVIEALDIDNAKFVAAERNIICHEIRPYRQGDRPGSRSLRKPPPTPSLPREPELNEKQCSACKMRIHKDATRCPHCRAAQPAPEWASAIGIVLVIFIVLICGGVFSITSSSSTEQQVGSYESYAESDPRDKRWDSPAGREVIRALAEDAGVSQAEMRRAVNDELDRLGLSDWADGEE